MLRRMLGNPVAGNIPEHISWMETSRQSICEIDSQITRYH